MYIKEFGLVVKGTDLPFKDIDNKQGIVLGYYSAFGLKDADGQFTEPGAFLKSIEERGPKSAKPRIKHLLDHNRTIGVGQLQELYEDKVGLVYQTKAGRHTAGQDWLKMCEDGVITEHSTGTLPFRAGITKKSDGEHIYEAKLWEGSSLQAWGAMPYTPVTGFKNLKFEELKDRFDILDKAWRNGKYTDDTFTQVIEPELKHIKRIIDNFSDATTEPEPQPQTTQPDTKDYDLLMELKSINQIFN